MAESICLCLGATRSGLSEKIGRRGPSDALLKASRDSAMPLLCAAVRRYVPVFCLEARFYSSSLPF